MSDEKNFLSRWAKRKAEHRQEQGLPLPRVETPESTTLTQTLASPSPDAPVAVPSEAPGSNTAPAPRMEDVALLTKDSDFAPFVAKNATELVKNAALKKLFSDPHFNIMDRLDIYIDDYGQPDPLPDGWLDKLEHAKGWLTPTDAERAAAKQAAQQPPEQSGLAGSEVTTGQLASAGPDRPPVIEIKPDFSGGLGSAESV